MEKNHIVIPQCLQIVIDDLGWMNGEDDRKAGGPSRTGMPRKHDYRDYLAINALGKRLNMKIHGNFILEEWDPDNRLRSIRGLSKYGESWDNAAYLDRAELSRMIEAIKQSDYIDIGLHGLGHGYYIPENDNVDTSDYYYTVNKEMFRVDEGEIRARLDAFFDLLAYYGIEKKITSFVPPTHPYVRDDLAGILVDYGIRYVSLPFSVNFSDMGISDILFECNGRVVTMDRYPDAAPWFAYNVDYDSIPLRCHSYGAHWPNFLHLDPARNMEIVERAAAYFERCGEQIGCILSEDMRFCMSQTLFFKYARICENKKGETVIDVLGVPKNENLDFVLYVNSSAPITQCEGARICEYARKKDFITYKLIPENGLIFLRG